MAIGRSGGGYANLQATPNYVGEALGNIEQNAFKYRAEKRLEDEKKQAKEEALDRDTAGVLDKIKNVKTTKFATQNALAIDASTKLAQGVAEKARQLKNGKVSKLDFDIYKSNALAQIDLMNQANERINTQGADYSKQLAEGKISPLFADNALSFGNAFSKNNIHMEANPDGTLTSYAYDNTDPKNPKIIERGDLSTFGQYAFTPVANYDPDKDITEFKKTYPPVLTETFKGNTKVGVTGTNPLIDEAINTKVESLLADKNALAVANALRPNGTPNPNVTDPKDIQATRDFLLTRYKTAYSPKIEVDEATQRANLALQQSKEARERAKDEEAKSLIGDSTVITESGTRNGVVVPKDTRVFGIENVQKKYGTGGKTLSVKEVNVLPTGRIQVVTENTFEGETTKQKVPNERGLEKLKQFQTDSKGKVIKDKNGNPILNTIDNLNDTEINEITTANKEPTTVVYDSGKNNNEIAKIALLVTNPETGKRFKGAGEFNKYFRNKSGISIEQKNKQAESTIPTYTASELKGAGWNDQQIQQAVKLGKIKVN